MFDNTARLLKIQNAIKEIVQQLAGLPARQTERVDKVIDRCQQCLKTAPDTDLPVYIHITGTDKSFKTSYLLDLFDNDKLRELFAVKQRNTSENTAVPCLVEPVSWTDDVVVSQISISTGNVIRDRLTQEQFNRLYDLSSGADPDDYLIRVAVPENQTPMTLPVIEYPGIKEGADAIAFQKERHEKFQANMLDCLERYPGILVACFQHKIAIPPGHPLDAILKKYRTVLETTHAYQKLPLILSLQGDSAVASYCGNTNVEQDLESDFKSYKAFETVVQLINPCNSQYPVNFISPGPHVDNWIRNLSRYKDLREIKDQIQKDGGIAWSRQMLGEICTTSNIKDALDNMFLMPWIRKAEKIHTQAVDLLYEIESYDEVAEVKERIRKAILKDTYQNLRHFFDQEFKYSEDGMIQDHQAFWSTIFTQYLDQFLADSPKSKAIAEVLWHNMHHRLDPDNKGFLSARERDLPHIIMNMAEFYVPNMLVRGDFTLVERRIKEDAQHVV
ncbi:hypothetical protein [uncultured Desulfobacter sp.]|uniref:hypothetical protein n=1 Tax=uncultured Desulfobacter sp. TaxID=240139 RepID=UPI002AAAE2AF|nr:hypothetical protein [uncultured Desulfobacter sp.]